MPQSFNVSRNHALFTFLFDGLVKKPILMYALAFLLGAAMPLAFAPFHYWPVSILSIAGLILIWQKQSEHTSYFRVGLFFGLGYFGFGIHWVYYSLYEFGGATPVVATLITALLIFWQSLYIGLLGFVYGRVSKVYSQQTCLMLLPLLWFSMEWLKGIVITGFPWLSIGYSQIDSPLAVFAPWVGSYGLSALSVFISALIVIVLSEPLKKKIILVASSIGVMVILGVLAQTEQTKAMQKSLTITQIQGNIAQKIKWQADKRQQIFEVYWQQTQQHWDSDLIVWPETAVPGRSELIEESVLLPMSMIAAENETNVLFGVVVSDLAKSRYFNSMLMVGENQGVYHKRHLVPFGEYMPMRWMLDFVNQYIRIPMSDMQAGDEQQPLMMIDNIKLGVSICYEDVFSRDINQDLPEANILINTSNDAWFGDSLAPHQHLQIAQMRALETGRPMVRSTNTGITAFINYKGEITQRTQQFQVASISAEVVGRTGQTFFVWFSSYQWLIVLLTGIFCMVAMRKSIILANQELDS